MTAIQLLQKNLKSSPEDRSLVVWQVLISLVESRFIFNSVLAFLTSLQLLTAVPKKLNLEYLPKASSLVVCQVSI